MKISAQKYLCPAIPRAEMFAGALLILAVFAIQTPEPAQGQAGYYTQNRGFVQNGGAVWYGAQQQRVQQPAAGYYPAPGYIQIPAYSQPAVQGHYYVQGGYPAHPYQQHPAYAQPRQPYGYQQSLPTSNYGQTFVDRQRQLYGQANAYPGYAYGYPPPTGYPSHNPQIAGQPVYGQPGYGQNTQSQPAQAQPGQQPPQPNQGQHQNPHARNQLTPVQQAARQAATNIAPNGAPVLSPAAQKFFQNLQGPNRTTFNQNRQNYSFHGQARPSNAIPNTTWQSGSRFGQTWSHRNSHNQSAINQNRFNYSLHNLTQPGLRGSGY